MATEKQILQDSGAAAADYSAKQHYAVYHSAAETLTLNATAGGWTSGALQDNPESGEFGTVQLLGLSKAEAGGTWAVGDPLTTDSSGKFVKSLDQSDYIKGRALETAASGDVRTMYSNDEGYNSAFGHFTADGIGHKGVLRTTFDPSTNASERTVAAHSSTQQLPDNAVITQGFYYVATTFTSAADTATISIGHADDAAGIIAAIAINDGSNPWDAGWFDCIQDGTAANVSTATTAARPILFTVAVQALTAGKLILFLEYVIID